jgi:hypothetical protein
VIGIQKDWETEFLPQASHQRRNLPNSNKIALALGDANQDRDLQFLRRGEHRL